MTRKSNPLGQLPRSALPGGTAAGWPGPLPGGAATRGQGFFPPNRPLEQNSVTKLQALVPVRVATSMILEGDWTGHPLTAARVVGSLFGGKHFILQIGHEVSVGETLTFRLVFVAHLPAEDIESNEAKEDAVRTAEAFMHMLNLRRKDSAYGPVPSVPPPIPGTRPRT